MATATLEVKFRTDKGESSLNISVVAIENASDNILDVVCTEVAKKHCNESSCQFLELIDIESVTYKQGISA
ncbi:MAG: hypothetical protein Athens101428_183 [Candidatus Berkelbacteria bacterium Athens1014_28]|uniref:Uncharacterized protein n=1 Tax=Candidatus Berkelbacteria bacterium Athens1014_28 TaxID=2017145 RepID=A0A554LPA7_9BACT|nr:MAG: hypothetical protein Athens101428_183 [Candidatus Berkelbacteria bacterium Athens1014_28]